MSYKYNTTFFSKIIVKKKIKYLHFFGLPVFILRNSVEMPNILNLDPDQGFWPNLDPDPESSTDPDPTLLRNTILTII